MGVYIAVCVKRAQAFGCRGMSAAIVACCYTKEVITAFFGVSVCSFLCTVSFGIFLRVRYACNVLDGRGQCEPSLRCAWLVH